MTLTQMSQNRIPLLLVGDDPNLSTGLARILRDLAGIANTNCDLEVAVLGNGADCDRSYVTKEFSKIPLYRMSGGAEDCGFLDMPRLEKLFFKGRKPIVWPIWDATRALWMDRYPWFKRPSLWGYFPFDSYGLNKEQPRSVTNILKNFDHIVVPSQFAARSIEHLKEYKCGVEVLPHGYNHTVFYPRDPREAREFLGVIHKPVPIVGVVATNQARKDWGMVADTCRSLLETNEIHFWWHTDSLDRCWNMALLLHEFNLKNHVTITHELPEELLAQLYSACKVTIAPGLGEGFGYPILESIACGTPVVHGAYGAGCELIGGNCGWHVVQYGERWESTSFPVIRPMYLSQEFAEGVRYLLKSTNQPRTIAETVRSYRWDSLYPRWQNWIKQGITKHREASIH